MEKRTSKTIERAIKSRPGIVRAYWWEDKNSGDNPWWVSFNGYTVDNHGQHGWCGTAKEVAQFIRNAVPCECNDCKKERSKHG